MNRACFRRIATGIMLTLAVAGPASKALAVSPRAQVQSLLRRFAFSDSPETVSTVLAQGAGNWLAQQLNWQSISDAGATLETPPDSLNSDGSYKDYTIYERILMQHLVLTPRQVQAKLELHWLDHFSVSLGTVFDPAIMAHYDATVRANALGNFATLLTAVAKEPAMLIWLNNNLNQGANPNENFAREVMQLYSTGLYQLAMDGSIKRAGNNQPRLNYTESDVKAIASAITGYSVVIDGTNMNPQTRFSVQFTAANHNSGAITFLGRPRKVPNNATAMDFVMNILAHQPSTAPFMAREMLQRFVCESPSPKYIAAIAAVWQKTEDAPDQIAQVVTAIVNNPEFSTHYHGILKQPVELVLGSLRQLPGVLTATSTTPPASMLLWEMHYVGQQLFYPPNVFSFYTPGDLASTVNSSTVLYRSAVAANMVNGAAGQTGMDTYIDIPTLRQRIGSTAAPAIADYLLDATLDGGTTALRTQIIDFLGQTPSDNQIRGAMWLILNAPDYAVN